MDDSHYFIVEKCFKPTYFAKTSSSRNAFTNQQKRGNDFS